MRLYKLLYKIGYRSASYPKSNPMWKYEVLKASANSLKAAKAKIKKSHPKATILEYQGIVR